MKKRPVFHELLKHLREPRRFIQVLLGPRQVGKTTLALQAAKAIKRPFHYISADLATLQDLTWLQQQWEVARHKVKGKKGAFLIIDEVQKIPNWSEMVKFLWDEDTQNLTNLSVVILGSSPWLMRQGLTESLAGRFETLPITHWSFEEMNKAFGWSVDKYIYFGGYPGAAPFADEKDPARWSSYINESLIETTISRDILLMTQVNKPALLRRLFQLGCIYSGQILAYTKMLGELQDAGNTTTLAHYLDLLAGAGLVVGLQKYAGQPVRQKGSKPKFCVFNTALMSAQVGKSFKEARKNHKYWGRLVESAIGAHLLNITRGTQIEVFYWREGDMEVDFVLQRGNKLTAIEVKSGNEPIGRTGIDLFVSKFKPSRILLVGEKGIPLKEFLKMAISDIIH
ncbi:MAG TPA: ATP-binding protein [Rhabdochlamydiaceae bacterium]|nr:ATP-binding protein [Rhabdochlamydiaceae bacterium]